MKRIPTILLGALLVPAWASAQDYQKHKADAVPAPAPVTNLQGAWDPGSNSERAAYWEKTNASRPDDATLQWNWFRSEYDALNSRNNGQLQQGDRQRLDTIAGLIGAAAPNSFEQHLAGFYLQFPAAPAFAELDAAAALAPERTELIAPMLSKAMCQGDAAGMKKWATTLDQRGGLSPALTAVAQDVLLSVPAGAILFANGDMDTHPLVVTQLQGNRNPGVVVVDRRLLADAGYRTRIWAQVGGKGPVPAAGPGFAKALLADPGHPVYFTLSLDRSWLEAFAGQLHAVGAAFRVGNASPGDAAQLARNWTAMRKPDNAGPLSCNYLLPGAVLMGQLERAGDTAGAARVESDLRRLAKATGTLVELRQRGILKR